MLPAPVTPVVCQPITSMIMADLSSARMAADRWIAIGLALPPGELQKRLGCFRDAAHADPNGPEPWRLISHTLGEMGRWADALHAADRALALSADLGPDETYDCWLVRAQALIALKRLDEGLACCDTASTIRPDGCAPYEIKGLALHDAGRFDEAIACFERYIDRARYAFLKAWGWNYTAASLRRLGRFREALDACERAIESCPEESSFWGTRGNCLRDMGRFDEALQAQAQAVHLWPANPVAWYNQALLFEGLGRWADAVESYEQYLTLVPAGDDRVQRRLSAAREKADPR